MEYLKDKKIVGSIILLTILFAASFIYYGKDKSKVFKDEYMDDIFVEVSEANNTNTEVINIEEANNKAKEFIIVEIKGEVLNPDVYNLEEGSIIRDLIEKAGGLTKEADISRINRAQKLQNHQLLTIPSINDIELQQNYDIDSYDTLININTANIDELKNITGIGDVKAKSIIEYREKIGGFKNIEEIKEVEGIGDKTFEKIKDEITL